MQVQEIEEGGFTTPFEAAICNAPPGGRIRLCGSRVSGSRE